MQNFAHKTILALIITGASAFAAEKTKTFKGAWFDISYPSTFTAQPSIKSEGVPGKYESAFFVSPDKTVRFYIFSPQWAGENADIAVKATDKAAVTEKTEKANGTTRRYFTIQPKAEGFTRSYVETTNEDATVRWVIGIEYANKEAYEKYKSAYLKFKKSLRQFAD